MKVKVMLIALVFACFSGCASRSKLPPDKALLGQWKSAATRFYIGPEKIYDQDIASGNRMSFEYKVVSVNENDRTVTIRFPSAPLAGLRIFRFTEDRKSLIKSEDFHGPIGEPVTFRFVDDKQEP